MDTADSSKAPVTTPVTDRRPVPRGVLPRGVQTWLMAGLAAAMLLIIVLTGQPDAPASPRPVAAPVPPTSSDRVREYQERLRMLEAQARQEAQATGPVDPTLPPAFENDVPTNAPRVDPVAVERQRREYESLFASNLVVSRRPEGQQPESTSGAAAASVTRTSGELPSVDAIADAVVRATARHAPPAGTSVPDVPQQVASPVASPGPVRTLAGGAGSPPEPSTSPNRVLEGTFIDTVLTNRLDGAVAAPVSCVVTNPVYALSGRDVLIPAGARILGETRPVQALGESRLAVAFHRLMLPDGRSLALDQFKGLNQIGDAGLRDKVTHHYWSTFGAAAAIGMVSGLSQLIGTAGLGLGDGDRTVVVAGSVADASAQATAQVMARFLNRLPTVTIREGHRVKVYVTSDLELPVWQSGDVALRRR